MLTSEELDRIREMATATQNGEWWCHYCGTKVDPANVTSTECHESCGMYIGGRSNPSMTLDLLDHIAELEKRLAGCAATEWEPIIDGPRDGSQVLGLSRSGAIVVCRWREYKGRDCAWRDDYGWVRDLTNFARINPKGDDHE